MARTRDSQTRNSSYRDARSSSLQRMVRRSFGLATALARGCKTGVQVRAALGFAASGRLRCPADANEAESGWGAGRKLPAKRTDSRTEDVERGCADDSESEAQTGTTPLIAARVATWPKPGNAKLSKLVRHAARVDAPDSPADAQATSD